MDKKKNQQQVTSLVNRALAELGFMGIYVANLSVTTASAYLKFGDERMRSMTIRDHATKPKYKYKWNLIIGYHGPNTVKDQGVTRYMYNEQQVKDMFRHMTNYWNKINHTPK